ncbi:hypothetical protein F7725_018765 [Dissostichus mawsoni]|uniref:Protein lifeguard 1-like n=1 Tax=Dissostichus mawsoni TaxID=36200 RepID=A0A7J5XV86_DISMA|nr:hypothetical protein F7725_018765 [Dissostichus mawsoni]
MESKDDSNGGYGPHPPPYDHVQSPYTGTNYQVGNGNVAVVSPSGPYDNSVHPEGLAPDGGEQQYGQAPPGYSQGLEDSSFSDAAIRELLVTVGIICAFLYWDALREWTWANYWFSYVMMATVLVLILVLSCCDNLRRQVPLNFIALGLFTVAEGLMLGSVSAYYNADAVLWAVGATALVSFSLTVFAMQTKWDFTGLNGSLWVFAWTLFSFALLCGILRSQYLVFDTQLILGGKHRKYEVSPEEYVFAALNLYLDIVSLFLLLLQLIGLCR